MSEFTQQHDDRSEARPGEHDAHRISAELRRARLRVREAGDELARLAAFIPPEGPGGATAHQAPVAPSARETWTAPVAAALAVGAIPLLLGSTHAAPFGIVGALVTAAVVHANEEWQRSVVEGAIGLPGTRTRGAVIDTPRPDAPAWPTLTLSVVGAVLGACLAAIAVPISWSSVAIIALFGGYAAAVLGACAARARHRWTAVAARRCAVMRHEQEAEEAARAADFAVAEVQRLERALAEALRWDGLWPAAGFAASPWRGDGRGHASMPRPSALHAVPGAADDEPDRN